MYVYMYVNVTHVFVHKQWQVTFFLQLHSFQFKSFTDRYSVSGSIPGCGLQFYWGDITGSGSPDLPDTSFPPLGEI